MFGITAELERGSSVPRMAVNLPLSILLAFWCGLGLPPVPFILPVGAIVIAGFRLPWLLNLGALLLLPSLFAASWGHACYWLGCARMHGMGLYRPLISTGLDRETRVPHTTGGCLVSGGEWMVTAPNNFAVYLNTKLFGFMRGTYTGPWPSADESRAALQHGQPVSPQDLAAGQITIGSRHFELDASARTLAQAVEHLDACGEEGCITGAVSVDGCLVLGFSDFETDAPKIIVPIGCTAPALGQPLGWYHARSR
jgi:hypothetical protein